MNNSQTKPAVEPNYWTCYSMSIAQLWGSGPKVTCNCGCCSMTFKQRIPIMDRPGIQCPNCGTINIIDVVVVPGQSS